MQTVAGPEHKAFRTLLTHWDKETPGRIFEADRALRDLRESYGWTVLQELVAFVRERKEAQMKYGPITEQGEYARNLGVIVGIEMLESALEAVAAHAESVQAQQDRELVEA